jgi:hypothetical protein
MAAVTAHDIEVSPRRGRIQDHTMPGLSPSHVATLPKGEAVDMSFALLPI